MTAETLAAGVRAGDRRALARAISIVEGEGPAAAALVGALHPDTGRAAVVGVTGPPGAGKSTLVDALVHEWRRRGRQVGVLAVDPTSPFTGGALLGDRIRMPGHAADPGVFIRSMATRGALGGLARATGDAAAVLDAAGFDLVLVETVGVGQDEVDVVRTADVSVVVLVPGLGDEVQALKAGLMEIADVFVVNKADREGADQAAAAIEALLAIGGGQPGNAWTPPVLRMRAADGHGVPGLADAIEGFLATQRRRLDARRRLRSEARVRDLRGRSLLDWLARVVLQPGEFAHAIDRVAAREIDPHAAAAALLERATAGPRASGH